MNELILITIGLVFGLALGICTSGLLQKQIIEEAVKEAREDAFHEGVVFAMEKQMEGGVLVQKVRRARAERLVNLARVK